MSKLILSLDGGGIRGAASAQFLMLVEKKLQQAHQTSLRDCIDFYAGTSSGAIITLALANTSLTMAEINNLFNEENAKEIFTENTGFFEVDGINAPKYEAKHKTNILKSYFDTAKIGDIATNKHVLAITYDVEKRKPVVIKSTKLTYLKTLSYQVADASSAAPTFFPTRNINFPPDSDESWLIDGGVIANNPAMCAIAEAKKVWQMPLEKIRILSVGTGYMTRKINGPASRKWGGLQWMLKGHIIEVLSDEHIVAYQCLTLMTQGSYIRVNAKLMKQPGLLTPPDDAIDDISKTNIKRLRLLGDMWFKQYGDAVIALLLNTYQGKSLDRIDEKTGIPIHLK
jgi:hypothetical protein